MAENAVVVIGDEELLGYLEQLPVSMFDAAKTAYRDAAKRGQKAVKERVRTGAGGSVHSRSGQLGRSIKMQVHGDSIHTLGSSVFSDRSVASYAHVHETGMTIKAKNAYAGVPGGPYLNIPTAANRTPAGVMRMSARDVFARGGFITKGPLRWVVMLPAQNAPTQEQFEEAAESGESAIAMFVLVKSVDIPARLKMRETVTGELPEMLKQLDDLLQEALQ